MPVVARMKGREIGIADFGRGRGAAKGWTVVSRFESSRIGTVGSHSRFLRLKRVTGHAKR
jgi:hypothetical protein